MATLLTESSLPLWVWILVIAVGSLVVLGTIAFFIRVFVNRRRQASFIDTFGDENLPQRRVTVRRGRVVEQSKYLSLTGSKYGLNAFGTDGNDGSNRDGARSKSPFEWWSNVKDRSQSRNSQITQITTETSSVCGPPSPNITRMYQRQDLNMSTSTLGSAVKDDASVTISVTEEPSSPPRHVRNFSRSFSRQGHSTPFSPRLQTLSRIEESSPHNSMISERASRIASYAEHRDGRASAPSPLIGSPASTTHFLRKSLEQHNSSRKSSLQYEAVNHAFVEPPPMAYNGARSSFGDAEIAAPSRSKRNSGGQSKAQKDELLSTPSDTHQAARTEKYPRRLTSKNGRVLRKKSLTKSALVSQVDS